MLTRPDSSPPESAVGTTPALPPGGGRRMSGRIFRRFLPLFLTCGSARELIVMCVIGYGE
ncbi:hypothetical protein GCM10010243_46050 [Streptomyces matensis]|nr:hypothetical protein GCM10010243_46050 [Streptomyces matensis]